MRGVPSVFCVGAIQSAARYMSALGISPCNVPDWCYVT